MDINNIIRTTQIKINNLEDEIEMLQLSVDKMNLNVDNIEQLKKYNELISINKIDLLYFIFILDYFKSKIS
jgi:wobble nucleotide-excising tRNase